MPFTHLASLGGGPGLRGFDEGRFRDRASADLSSEWRYEVWRSKHGGSRVEGLLLFDLGTVVDCHACAHGNRWSVRPVSRAPVAAPLRPLVCFLRARRGVRSRGPRRWTSFP